MDVLKPLKHLLKQKQNEKKQQKKNTMEWRKILLSF